MAFASIRDSMMISEAGGIKTAAHANAAEQIESASGCYGRAETNNEHRKTRAASAPDDVAVEAPAEARSFFASTNHMTKRQIEADGKPCPLTRSDWNANSLK